jgi:hypothetical protein
MRAQRIVLCIAMILFALAVMLAPAAMWSQAPSPTRDTGTAASGATLTFRNDKGDTQSSFEYLITGGPATASIVLKGCRIGGTCDTVETSTATASAIHNYNGPNQYDYFTVAPTFTGGTAPAVTVNRLSVRGGIVGSNAVGGGQYVGGAQAAADAVANTGIVFPTSTTGPLGTSNWLYDGTNWDRQRSAAIANYPTSTTTTARNSIGETMITEGPRWTAVSSPAVSNQASASIASEAGVRHVATRACFSAGSTTAPAATMLKVNLRDGATGAGTILTSWTIAITAAAGQNVQPYCFPIGPLVGTTATAMTLEFSALLTNLVEDVTLQGYNIN